MKKLTMVTLVTIMLAVFLVIPALAAPQNLPIGACPVGFELHPFMMHEGEHEDHDHHIGLAQDLNRDGYICVMHLDSFHVHMDNVLRYVAR